MAAPYISAMTIDAASFFYADLDPGRQASVRDEALDGLGDAPFEEPEDVHGGTGNAADAGKGARAIATAPPKG